MWHLEMGKLQKGLEFHPAIHEAAQKSLDEHGDHDPHDEEVGHGR